DLLGKRRPASFINDGASTCVAITLVKQTTPAAPPSAGDDGPAKQGAPAPKAGPAQPAPAPPDVEADAVEQRVETLKGVWLATHVDFQGEKQGIQPSLSINRATIQRSWDIVRRNNRFQFTVSPNKPLSWTYVLTGANAIDLTCVDGANRGATYPGI